MTRGTNRAIGQPMDRVDGRLKVTGGAKYSAEIALPDLAYAVIFQSTIAKGRIKSIDTSAALKAPGVLDIITHLNAPKLKPVKTMSAGGSAAENFLSLQDPTIYYSGQHIGAVVADTLEQAQYAASLVRVEYEEEKPDTEMELGRGKAVPPKDRVLGRPADVVRGTPERGLAEAAARVEEIYTTPTENHNPMEPHATTAVWSGDRLTVYDATQGVFGVRSTLATTFGIPEENVCAIANFVGGGFGCKGSVWSHVSIAALAARQVRRPVKLVLTRQQMFTSVGHRAETYQEVALGADAQGKLTAVVHKTTSHTSPHEEFVEPCTMVTRMMYATPNFQASQRLVELNKSTPTFMRAPGEASGMFALESALDELAYQLKMDPIELRIRNYADVDPEDGRPWSSKSLKECYQLGAERIGWAQRNPTPRSMRDGRYLIGMGMASATYPMYRFPAGAKVRLTLEGDNVKAVVQSGTTDIGVGTYTAMKQIAADRLGLPYEAVEFELGDTRMPLSFVAGGSSTIASVGSAIVEAATALREKVMALVRDDTSSPLHSANGDSVGVGDGRIYLKSDSSKGETYAAMMKRLNVKNVEASIEASKPGEESKKYSMHAFGAQFARVRVDPDLGEVRVTHFVGAYGAGRIINPKTARSQAIGGIVMGIGMALHEETVMDNRTGRIVNASLGEYHVPVNADIPEIEPYFVEENDPHVNPLGTKGIGEIGIVGVPAAIANAVYHATGKRIRDLPITPDKLL